MPRRRNYARSQLHKKFRKYVVQEERRNNSITSSPNRLSHDNGDPVHSLQNVPTQVVYVPINAKQFNEQGMVVELMPQHQ